MSKYIIKRILQSLVTIFIIVSFVIISMYLAPMRYDGINANPSFLIKNLYVFWRRLLLEGSFGTSKLYVGPTILDILIARARVSFILFGLVVLIGYALGLILGVLYTKSKLKWINNFAHAYYVFVISVPEVVIYLAFQFYLVRRLGFPVVHRLGNVFSWIPPIFIGSFVIIGKISFFVRRYILNELNADYVRFAKAKGLSENIIFYKHILKNISVYLIRDFADTLFHIMSFGFFLEISYANHGLSDLLYRTLSQRDTPFVQSIILVFTVFSIVVMLLADIIVRFIDPRIKDYR